MLPNFVRRTLRAGRRRRFAPPIAAALGLALALAPSGAALAKRATASSEKAPPVAAGAPRLLVAIAVDQFSADLFAQYRQRYTGGFARLMQGAVYPSAFQSHAATETCPGHSTLLTGVHPARTGIIANNWFDTTLTRADHRVYCAEDESDPASTSKNPVVSAVHLKVPTLGERMKAAWPQSRNVAVSAKDRAVMMMGGHVIDQAYWWLDKEFVTLKGRAPTPAALAENASVAALLDKGAPALTAPAWCAARSRAIAPRPLSSGTAPFTVGDGAFALAPGKGDDFRVSPRIDAATLDLAVKLADQMKLGKGPVPDMLSVSLSATDYIGHAYGTEGEEMCVQMAELDASLGQFFARLDALGIDYAVVLTADHGGLDVPERLAEQGARGATRVSPALTASALSGAIAAKLGLASDGSPLVVADAPFGDYYVNKALPKDQQDKVVAMLADLLRADPEVEAAYTHADIEKVAYPRGNPQDWSIAQRVRASYDPARTGDVFSVLKRTVVPIPFPRPGYTATHGSVWDYDRRVPLLFWRPGLAGLEQPQPVETTDIAPTFAALIGLKVAPDEFDGRCLDIDGGPADTCAGAAK